MNKAKHSADVTRHNLPPFDLVFCRDDPDQEIVFVLGSDSTKDSVQDLFPDLLLDKHEIGWVGCVARDGAFRMAPEAALAGFRVAFGELRDGMLKFRRVQIVETRQ